MNFEQQFQHFKEYCLGEMIGNIMTKHDLTFRDVYPYQKTSDRNTVYREQLQCPFINEEGKQVELYWGKMTDRCKRVGDVELRYPTTGFLKESMFSSPSTESLDKFKKRHNI